MHKEGSSPKASEIAEELITSGGKIGLNILLPILGPIINEAFALRSRLAQKREEKHDDLILKKLDKTLEPIIKEAFDFHPHIYQKRKELYLGAIIKKLEKINEKLIDKEFIQTEDFTDLIQTILNKISLRQASKKAEFFANLSVASMLKIRSHHSLDWQFRFIEIISELNESEMILLKNLNDHLDPSGASLTGVSKPFGLDRKEFDLCFDSLISKGLVFDASLSGMPSSTSSGVDRTPQPRDRIGISPLAKKVIHFIPEIEGIVNRAIES